MRFLLSIALGVGAAGSGGGDLTNLAALIVALGTAAAGIVAYLRLRQDRPRVVAEIAGLAETRLRAELETAWNAVDRLREREEELEREVADAHTRILELEQEREQRDERIAKLERIVEALD